VRALSPAETAQRDADTWDWCGPRVQRMVRRDFPSLSTQILDVGACWGKYRRLLPEYPMDACEIWPPYVRDNDLHKLYRRVYQRDICDHVRSAEWQPYDVVILGDVFEHIPRDAALPLLGTLLSTCREVIVVVPFEQEQGPEHDNPYQVHAQADLTLATMHDWYRGLDLLDIEIRDHRPFKGIYRRKR
jgi:hypothetical protein